MTHMDHLLGMSVNILAAVNKIHKEHKIPSNKYYNKNKGEGPDDARFIF